MLGSMWRWSLHKQGRDNGHKKHGHPQKEFEGQMRTCTSMCRQCNLLDLTQALSLSGILYIMISPHMLFGLQQGICRKQFLEYHLFQFSLFLLISIKNPKLHRKNRPHAQLYSLASSTWKFSTELRTIVEKSWPWKIAASCITGYLIQFKYSLSWSLSSLTKINNYKQRHINTTGKVTGDKRQVGLPSQTSNNLLQPNIELPAKQYVGESEKRNEMCVCVCWGGDHLANSACCHGEFGYTDNLRDSIGEKMLYIKFIQAIFFITGIIKLLHKLLYKAPYNKTFDNPQKDIILVFLNSLLRFAESKIVKEKGNASSVMYRLPVSWFPNSA